MPYRMDMRVASDAALDRLVELGALDVELLNDGRVAVLLPDSVSAEAVSSLVGASDLVVSPAIGRDAESVWILNPRPVHVAGIRIVPAQAAAGPGVLRLIDSAAFGTGLHPTTALCLESLETIIKSATPDSVLDVGTGSGVLALGALMLGARRALAIDVDEEALRVAAENARLNALDTRLELACGDPHSISGTWPLVAANVLAAPLIEMAPVLVRRVGHHGHLVLSGIPSGVEPEVDRAYRRLGMRGVRVTSRAGWAALVLRASW